MGIYLITGGAGGMGGEIARALHGTGHSILFADIARLDLPGIRSVFCDFSDEGQIASLMLGVEAVEGRLDGLVHDNGAEPVHDSAYAITARLLSAAAPLLRAGGGTAIALAPTAMPLELQHRLGDGIKLNWLAAPEEDAGAATLAAQAADLLVASV